ncbi:accessory regulator T protein [Streptococcus sanguinis SK1087]|jgi:hypothetical protein|uniref:Accessory regulator T protein n=3 Tax=Streptococcus sanguinis TaxID=1305 RepID=F3SJM1_STRSA|nr:accessory regulator T protein [Streptococcus sanguinis SK330]EGG39924.1 accessory regulator T protein [Streptococcus sanguinis SK1087]EGJ38424.1 hypothetical protein HMPREF9393_1375 [Streptococcus sanguinis SK1056]
MKNQHLTVKKYFFCKTLDIFLNHGKIIFVKAIKSLSKVKNIYKEIFANE